MAFPDEKKWIATEDNDRVTMHPVSAVDGFRNHFKQRNILIPADQGKGFTTYKVKDFVGEDVPDGTNYPVSVAPIGSTFLRLTISGGAVTEATMYLRKAAGWKEITTAA